MSEIKISPTGYYDGEHIHEYHMMSKPLANWIVNYLKDEKEKQK